MSQRRFHHGTRQIMTGYDRPLRHFFLLVEDPAGADAGRDRYLYSYLADPEADRGGLTLAQVRARLAQLGIPEPSTLATDLAADQVNQTGNVVHDYGAVD
jgi:hypothetical protein